MTKVSDLADSPGSILARAPARVAALDGLRGAALLLVMVYHCTVIKPLTWYERWYCAYADLGRFGVDLFFVLSGFLITNVLRNTPRDTHFFRNFYIRRALRIFPLYYALVAVGVVAAPFLASFASGASRSGGYSGHQPESCIWYLTYCTNFLVAMRNAWPHGLLDVSWSLCIEEHFYIVWPVLVFAARRRSLQLILVGAIVLSVVVRSLMWRSGYSPLQIYVLTFTRLDGLSFGALISLSLSQVSAEAGNRLRQKAWQLFLASCALLVVLVSSRSTGFDSPVMSLFGYTFVSGMFASLLAAISLSPAKSKVITLLEHDWLRTVGRYSYALYLVHLPVRSLIRDRIPFGNAQFRSLHGFALIGQFAFYGASMAASLLVAWVSWNVLEKRFLDLKDRLAGGRPVAPLVPIHAEATETVATIE